jgi:cytochrome c553
MSVTDPAGLDRPWRLWATAVVVFIIGFGTFCGLVLIPVVQGRAAGIDAWTAICRAMGILPGSPAVQQPLSMAQARPTTEVAWTPDIITRLTNLNPGQGPQLAAETCSACHGPQGISADPQFPDLAGQSAFAIYKQLHDYRNGARVNELMAGIVRNLDDTAMADVAAYWSLRTTGDIDPRQVRLGDEATIHLIERGDAARGLPACVACHSIGAGGPIETPTLAGQRSEYVALQLRNFRDGARRNDIYGRMRDIAGKLTDEEISKLAQYYSRVR